MSTGLTYDPRMEQHYDPTGFHVERPERTRRIFEMLDSEGLVVKCQRIEAVMATEEQLARVHQRDYVMKVTAWKDLPVRQRMADSFKYTSVYNNEHTTEAALLSSGSVVNLVDLVVKGTLKNAVAVVRPPGHHAEETYAMGFCLFNNVAVAAAHARDALGLKRILIVDWDVHHGNGTQHMFWKDPSVLFFSLHRYDNGYFDPGGPEGDPSKVGEGPGAGKNINVGWNTQDVGDESYVAAFEQILLPVCEEFQPELVIVSAGFDSAEGDPLGQIHISPAGYSYMTHKLMELAGGKVVVALEGGYNLDAISKSMAAVVSTLVGNPPLKMDHRPVPASCQDSINTTIACHRNYWKVFQAPKRKIADISN